MLQLSLCRQSFETDELLKMEFKVLKSVIARGLKAGGFAIAHGTRLAVDGADVVYLRWMEQGVLTGLGELFWLLRTNQFKLYVTAY